MYVYLEDGLEGSVEERGIVNLRVGQDGEQGGMGLKRGDESVAEGHALAEDPLTGARHPKGLYVADEGQDILGRLGPVLPVDLILGRQMADKSLPGGREFIPFDVEGCDRGISDSDEKSLLDCTRVSNVFPTEFALHIRGDGFPVLGEQGVG